MDTLEKTSEQQLTLPDLDPVMQCKQFKRLRYCYFKTWDVHPNRKRWVYIQGCPSGSNLYYKIVSLSSGDGPLFRASDTEFDGWIKSDQAVELTYEQALKRSGLKSFIKPIKSTLSVVEAAATSTSGAYYCSSCQQWHKDSPCIHCQDGQHMKCTGFWQIPSHVPCKCECQVGKA